MDIWELLFTVQNHGMQWSYLILKRSAQTFHSNWMFYHTTNSVTRWITMGSSVEGPWCFYIKILVIHAQNYKNFCSFYTVQNSYRRNIRLLVNEESYFSELKWSLIASNQIKKIKSLLYLLNTLSGVTSERCPSMRLCAKAHTIKVAMVASC